jgi:hypothetical protein
MAEQQRLQQMDGGHIGIDRQYVNGLNGAIEDASSPSCLDGTPGTPPVCTTRIEDFIRGRRLELQFSACDDGTLRVMKMIVGGQDRTAEALHQGGAAVQVGSAPCYLQHLPGYSSVLGWEPQGKFGHWFRRVTSE